MKENPENNKIQDVINQGSSPEAQRLSEICLYSIINQSPYSLWISDEKGTLIWINQACLDLLNISEDELVDKYNILKDNLVAEQGFLPLVKSVFETGDPVKFEIKYNLSNLKNPPVSSSANLILEASIFAIKNSDGKITNAVIQHADITKRKRVDQALLESEIRSRMLFNEIKEAVSLHQIIYNEDKKAINYKILDVNPQFENLLNFRREEVINKLGTEIYKTDDPPYLAEFAGVVKTGQPYHFVSYMEPVDKYFYISASSMGNDLFATIYFDITDRKQAEELLSASEERFRHLVKSVSDYIYTYKIEPGGRAVTSHGPGCVTVTGYTSGEYEADPYLWFRMVHEEDRKAVLEQAASLQKGLDTPPLEHRIIHKNGTIKWVKNTPVIQRDEHSHFLAYDGLISDITERKQAEEALRISEEKYREMFERAVEGMFQCTPQGRFINVNPYFAAMLGYESAEELIGLVKNIGNELFINIEESRNFIKLLNDNGTVSGFEHEVYKKDRSRIWVSANARIVRGAKKEVMYYEGTTVNITERKQAEEEKEKLQSQLRQAQKMEAIGTFIGGVAHDFNNILSVVLGYAALMQMDMKEDHPLRSYLDQIMASSEKAANLTRSLLAFSRKQPIDLNLLKLNEIIKSTETLLKRLLTEDIILKIMLTEDETTIMGETTQINQILFNLATNARDAMPKGGIITIETVTMDMDKDFTDILGYGKPGKYIMLSFKDTGTGMDEITKEQIFDPFFTTKEVGKGTGLGLSTVYGIVKNHNGYISVYSEPGIGTAFNIYFPVIQIMFDAEKAAEFQISRGRETILVAEDNGNLRQLIKTILIKYGYSVIEAIDGQDAVDKFINNENINLVILDSVMPKKNGREVADEINKINPHAKVLFTSGYTRDVILDKGIEEKEVDFISKPITPNALLYKVREVLDVK